MLLSHEVLPSFLPSNKFAAREDTKSTFVDSRIQPAQAGFVISPAANPFDGKNDGRRVGRLLFLFIVFVWLAAPVRAADRLDTALEKLIGKPVAWALVEASGTDDDPLLLNWVRSVGGRVATQAPRQDVAYSFRILGTSVANAEAAPGGYVFVTRGLLDEIESDDELAGILAHESAHVSKRHATQQIGENLLVLLLVSQIRGKNADAYRTAAQVYNALRVLNKSREHEAQADTLGLGFAQSAGYDPNGLVRFFERLDAGGREPNRLQQYLTTHPSPRRRVRAARENPVVRKSDPALRAATAEGYEARGLRASADALRAGRDPLRLPPARPVLLAPDAAATRRQVWDRADQQRRRLTSAFRAQQVGGALQRILLVNYQLDLRWFYLAARAYAVQTDAQNVYAQTLRALRTAPPTYDALAALTEPDAGENARRGRVEADAAVGRAGEAVGPLTRASQAAAAVLTDLNNPLYHPKGNLAWARYGALEGLLRYAEAELGRANRASGQAWRVLAFARIRRYEARISQLAPNDDTARRALFAELAGRRVLGNANGAAAFPGSGDLAAGGAAIQAALSVELNQPLELVAAGRGETFWADWVRANPNSTPENIATVLRLLALDLERETFLRDDSSTAPPVAPAAAPDAAAPTAAD